MGANVENEWWKELNLNYSGENNFASFFSSEGNIHMYPAKAVPEMVSSLLKKLKEQYSISKVLDPFVGSGTVALESKYLGMDFYGSDMNPLSILLTRTKALTVQKTAFIESTLRGFTDSIVTKYSSQTLVKLFAFENIDFWFKTNNIREISFLKEEIDCFLRKSVGKNRETFSLILLTAFSSTIRESSLTRNNEFKLYRMSPSDIKKFEIDSLLVFKDKISNLLSMLVETNKISTNETTTNIKLNNAKNLSCFINKGIDAILTSPPYGDSQSTVAYGQFSKLSLQWSKDLLSRYLGIQTEAENVDEYLLGGKRSTSTVSLRMILRRSETLRELFRSMRMNCSEEINNQRKLLSSLKVLQNNILEGTFNYKFLENNKELFELIRERIRLDFFRIYNTSTALTNKQIKVSAEESRDEFFNSLKRNINNKAMLRHLESKIPFVSETIKRKIKATPRRVRSILHFFKELYLVVEQTDKVLSSEGVQAWIVGHRTILGSINVDMAGILNDWFVSMGYSKITTLHRQYSFKRLPHHINSTASRKNEIKTMMQEHIVVVRKIKEKLI
ncbi:DNA adenine methylase [Paenibacillus chondroitinus]|uniref:site-specific DNA-methyltransferase (cytosine-N(4)-specific) n=1 Tax=Paenibacillus chondroitinus TaxID=59842 RepID=A0ABU6D529_9BACL|nr:MULTISPECIES: DNA adenine methylase [Paenibacillus]MCY9661291.1 site-specific DNA-methyltransferase [Paenibacillus anseongense]MEB4792545.1 DNA adenine methylase [Paenibacillus chondroitinus]